jgi:hypothetical protein
VAAAIVVSGGAAVTVRLTAAQPTAPGGPAADSPLDRIRPGEWYEAPNTQLQAAGRNVYPPIPTPPGNAADGPATIVDAWGGGAYDTKRDRLIIHGGGHGNYSGNEVYTFDVKTFRWSRPWGPSALSAIPPMEKAEGMAAYYDGNPSSVHTYDGMVYLPVQDKLWRVGGGLWSGSGGGTLACWVFDFDSLKWERKADSAKQGVSVFSHYDPVTGHIFAASDKYALEEYDPVNNTWRVRASPIHRGEEMTSVIDPENRLFVGMGNGQLSVFNLKTGALTNGQRSTGGEAIVNSRGPGLAYDPVVKRIVGWHGGTSVYSLDVSTWTWTEHKAATTNSVTPARPRRDVFGRFRYIPSKKVYILMTSVRDNVYFYKMAPPGGEQPAK